MKKQEIKSVGYLTAAMVFGLILIAGCASIQIWPDYQRTAENKMFAIQEKIGDGLKTGALSLDQSQSFLTKLKLIRTDYAALKDKSVYRDEWDNLIARIDGLGEEVDRAMVRTIRIQEPSNGDRIVALQRTIDDGRMNGRLPLAEGRDFQARLDAIRSDNSRISEGSRSPTHEEATGISRRLDALGDEINRSLARTTRIQEPGSGDRIVALQRIIDDGRMNGRLPLAEGRDFQSRLDAIRSDYSRMTGGSRSPTHEETTDISRRLDLLEINLNRSR
ncbi:MAG: hypothetical protein Q7U40_07200 [Desulfatirhabdiaceae bacterium]|nr:hypothetical protein [Desulfatirhabdiaceae bacterium]